MRLSRKKDYLSGVGVRKTTKNRKFRSLARFWVDHSFIRSHPRAFGVLTYIFGITFVALALANANPVHAYVPPTSGSSSTLAGSMSPTDEAYSYEYYQVISTCMSYGQLVDDSSFFGNGDRINVDNAKNGLWFKSSNAHANGPVAPYLSTAGIKTDSSGTVNCNDPGLVPNALALWGNWAYDDALCSSGFERVDSGQRSRCLDSQGGTDNFQKATNNIQKAFDTSVQGRVYGGSAPLLSDLAKYDLYMGTFQATCAQGAKVLTTKPPGSTNKDYKVTEVSGTGAGATTETKWYVGTNSYTQSSNIQYSPRSGDNMTCAQMAAAISTLAPVYAQFLKQGGDDSTSSSQSGNGVGSTTTCAVPNAFSWAICGLGTLFANLTDGIYQFIASFFLATNPSIVSTTTGPGTTYSAWQAVLSIANIVFVIIFLVIIFSQATGYGISNYGIKKMLPRLIIGIVLINLSFFLCAVAVDLSNIFGYGISTLFKNVAAPPTWSDIMKDILVTQFTGAAVGGAVLIGIVAFTTGIGISGVLVCLLVLVFIALFLLARQVLIILCVVLAPIAFAAWLLPNTEKFFKQWWKIFFAMLLVFPLASLVVGGSNLAASIIANSFNQTGSSNALIALASTPQKTLAGWIIGAIIQMLPLILIPLLLKGLLDAIPVVGKFARNAMNQSTGSAGKWAKDDASFFGRRRAEYNNNRRGLFGQPLQPGDKTLGNRWRSYKNARQEQVKTMNEAGHEDERARILDATDTSWSTRIAREAHHESQDTEVLKGQTDQGFKTQFAGRRVLDEKLKTMDQETQAAALAERNENIERQTQFAESLKTNDNGLLDIAQGTVNPVRGRTFALGAATSASFKEFDDNVNNQNNLLTEEMSEIEKQGERQDYDVNTGELLWEQNKDGSFRTDASGQRVKKMISGSTAAQRHLSRQLRSENVFKVAAARNKMFSQGASGITRWVNEWADMQRTGHFSKPLTADDGTVLASAEDMNNLKIDIQNNTKNEGSLAKALKDKNKLAMSAVSQGIDIDDFMYSDAGRAVVKGMSDGDVANSTTAFMLQTMDNGSFDVNRASGILSDDVIRNQYDQEKIQIMQVLKDGGSEPSGIFVKRKDKDGNLVDVELTTGQAAVRAIWDTKTGKLRGKPNPANPIEETNDTIDLATVVVPGLQMPGQGSPVQSIKNYLDQKHGVNRLSRDEFIELQKLIASTSTEPDNDDVIEIQADIRADAIRRNTAAQKINKAAGQTIYEDVPVPPMPAGHRSSSSGSGSGPKPASGPAPGPAPVQTAAPTGGYAHDVPPQVLSERLKQTQSIYHVSLQDLGLTQLEIDNVSQDVRDRINEVLRVYNGARRNAADTGSTALNEALRADLKKAIQQVIDGHWNDDYRG